MLTTKHRLASNLFGTGKIRDSHKHCSLLFHHFYPHVGGQSDRDTWLFSSCLGLAQSYRFPPSVSSGQVHYNPPHARSISLPSHRSVTVIKWELNRSRCSQSQMVSHSCCCCVCNHIHSHTFTCTEIWMELSPADTHPLSEGGVWCRC